jgi:hypothetical protein
VTQPLAGQLDSLLPRLHAERMLTVSDIPDFAARGGILGLKIVENRIRSRPTRWPPSARIAPQRPAAAPRRRHLRSMYRRARRADAISSRTCRSAISCSPSACSPAASSSSFASSPSPAGTSASGATRSSVSCSRSARSSAATAWPPWCSTTARTPSAR